MIDAEFGEPHGCADAGRTSAHNEDIVIDLGFGNQGGGHMFGDGAPLLECGGDVRVSARSPMT